MWTADRRRFAGARSSRWFSVAGPSRQTKRVPSLLACGAHLREADRATQCSRFVPGCAVSIGADDVPLTGIYSQEGAIAKVEQHLRGPHEMTAPADPFCRRMDD